MSRNLCKTSCDQCDGSNVWMIEPPRPATAADCGRYADEYGGMIVANATCRDCGAEYLAWVAAGRGWPRENGDRGFGDLSYRSTFNDEPGPTDLARFNIVRRRIPVDGLAKGPISFDCETQGAHVHVRVRCGTPGQRALLGTLVCSEADAEALRPVLSAEVIP